MAAPLYFLTGIRKGDVTRGVIEQRLAGSLDDIPFNKLLMTEPTAAGPGGKAGVIVTYQPESSRDPVKRVGYYPDEQRWEKHDETVWVGENKLHPVTLDDIQRAQTFRGFGLELQRHHAVIPLLRRPSRDDETMLPMVLKFNGEVSKQVRSEYREIWEQAGEICLGFDEPPKSDDPVWLERHYRFALQVLALNYRFGPAEQTLLELLDTDNFLRVAYLACDWFTYMSESQKKSDSESELTGCEAATETTSRLGST